MSPVALELVEDGARFGGKAAQLGAAIRAGLPVPRGFALDWAAVDAVVHGALDAAALSREIDHARRVAVRSSAVGEDGASASFAGQHQTVLGVCPRRGLREAVSAVRASAHAPAALAYRRRLGLSDAPRIGVVVQELVHAEISGVLFTRDPLTGEDVRVVEAAWGLGEVVVAGLVTPDRFRVARGGRSLAFEPGEKDVEIRWREDGEGTCEVSVPAERAAARTLSDALLAALDELATRCEQLCGGGLDLEFAFAGGRLFLLQQRAITRG